MGKRKVLLPAAMLLSALSALAGMLPYILIWLIVRELLEHGEITSSGNVVTYAGGRQAWPWRASSFILPH